MGIEDVNECPNLCKMAHDYLRRTKECEDNLFAFFANDPDHESLYVKLVEELDKCILGYFAFHWNHTTPLIKQVTTQDILGKFYSTYSPDSNEALFTYAVFSMIDCCILYRY